MLAELGRADNYINGEWIADGGTAESTNPADGSVLGHYVPGTRALADQAVAVARQTFDQTDWASSPRLRAAVLFEFADRLEAARDEIADLIVAENGKLRREGSGKRSARSRRPAITAALRAPSLAARSKPRRAISR